MPQILNRPLLLVGCGKMGGAMLEGWLSSGMAAAGVIIVDPAGAKPFAGRDGITVLRDAAELTNDLRPEVIVLAVKPQQMDTLLKEYRRFGSSDCLFLSIAAGKTLSWFEGVLGQDAAILRAMPNTPAAIGQGITVACPNRMCSPQQIALSEGLLQAVGEVFTVHDEGYMDAVTALGGGGPAYTFLLIEAMSEAGTAAGLPEDLAARLALVTVAGAGQLALESKVAPATLRENVTSPGGTTFEALKVLMRDQDGLPDRMKEAVDAATKRSRELGQ